MGADRFKKGLTKEQTENLHPMVKRFIETLEKKFGKDGFVITSAYRKGDPKRHGKSDGAEAFDLRPTEKLYDYLYNTKEGISLMLDHGLGLIDERSPEQQKKYGATGPNLHIGMDTTAVNPTKERLVKMNNGEIESLNSEFILSQKTNNYRTDALNKYDDAKKSIEDDDTLLKSEKETKLRELNRETYLSNNLDFINERSEKNNLEIAKEKQIQINEFKEGNSEAGALYGAIQNGDFKINDDGGFTLKISNEDYDNIKDVVSKETLEQFKLKRGFRPNSKHSSSGKFTNEGYQINNKDLNGAYNFLSKIEGPYKEITGNTLYFDLEKDPNNGNYIIDGKEVPATKLNINDTKADFKINESVYTPRVIKNEDFDPTPKVNNSGGSNDSSNNNNNNKETTKKVDTSISDKAINDIFSNYQDLEEIGTKDVLNYDKLDKKFQVPTDILAFGALALKGLNDTDNELPLRDEKISDALLNYLKENKRISQLGLKPEEEAAMKTDIADNYQEGITRLTRASGGNRNIVLGGLQGLNRNRLQGILAISMADVDAKAKGLAEYGQTLQYIEDFNTNRDIANHGIKYNEALTERKDGQDLASSAFASLVNEIQYQKENGPGSANARLKAAIEYETFGYVTGIKDDKSGTIIGTPSHLEARKVKQDEHNLNIRTTNEKNKSSQEQAKTNFYQLPETERANMKEWEVQNWMKEEVGKLGGVANPKSINTNDSSTVETFSQQAKETDTEISPLINTDKEIDKKNPNDFLFDNREDPNDFYNGILKKKFSFS